MFQAWRFTSAAASRLDAKEQPVATAKFSGMQAVCRTLRDGDWPELQSAKRGRVTPVLSLLGTPCAGGHESIIVTANGNTLRVDGQNCWTASFADPKDQQRFDWLAFQNKVRAQVTDPVLAMELIQGASQVITALDRDGSTRLAPKIYSLKRHANGRMHFQVEGTASQVYLVEASTSLLDWEAVGTTTLQSDGSFELEDPDAAKHPCRFYRVRQP